jgi:CubicO group peptidase (beta-lactamase class C family)
LHRGGPAWREYAFTTLDLQRIVSMISEENSASRRVAEKLRDESRASGDLGWGSAADVRLRSDRVAFDVIGRDAALTLDPALDDLLGARVRPGGGVVTVAGVVGLEGGRAVGTYGEAGDGRPPDAADSVFEIGSAEKVLTGTLLAEMIGRGEVALTDRVDDFLPSSVAVPSWKGHPIRLVDLATHTSGLPRLPTNLPISDPDNPLADYAVDQLYAFLSNYKLTRDVGAGYEYSNVGFGLLGHVLALRAGTTFAKLLRDRLLDPLGLATTSHRLTPAMARRLAIPHHEFGDVVPRWENPTLVGTGGLLSTIGDMLSFAAANIAAPTDRLRRAMAAA